jgi:hypothetical protein
LEQAQSEFMETEKALQKAEVEISETSEFVKVCKRSPEKVLPVMTMLCLKELAIISQSSHEAVAPHAVLHERADERIFPVPFDVSRLLWDS